MEFSKVVELIKTPKVFYLYNELPFNLSLTHQQWVLNSIDFPEYEFIWSSVRGRTININKLSLMIRIKGTNIGLLRFDYNPFNTHLNPDYITADLPDFLVPFANFKIRQNVSHVHFAVNGYAELVWAIPLENHQPNYLFCQYYIMLW